jgi:osmotically-inducible protein OsmY
MKKRALVALAVVAVAAVGITMARRHDATPVKRGTVEANVVKTFQSGLTDDAAAKAIVAAGVPVEQLIVRSSGDVMVLRGTADADAAQRAVAVVQSLGAKRVANLITPARVSNDDELRRQAERELAAMPGLHGAQLAVTCKDGVVVVRGKVQRELQKDLARETVKGLRGVRDVRIDLAAL